jgi:hypothetical protein
MLSSKITKQHIWCLSLSELRMIAKKKVEMPTANTAVKKSKLACGTELEITNGEIKWPGASKCEVDKARVRVLEAAKHQLHLRLKTTSAAHKYVTFGILMCGKC